MLMSSAPLRCRSRCEGIYHGLASPLTVLAPRHTVPVSHLSLGRGSMHRRGFLAGLASGVAMPLGADTQQAAKITLVGFLRFASPPRTILALQFFWNVSATWATRRNGPSAWSPGGRAESARRYQVLLRNSSDSRSRFSTPWLQPP